MNAEKNLSLWQIGNEYQRLFSQLYDEETGEVNMEVQAQIDALEPSAEKKCIAYASWIRKMEADEKELEALTQEIAKRREVYTKEINKWHNMLYTNMKRCGIKEIKCPYFTLKIKTNPYSTDILNENDIPEQFMRTREIVKTEIKPDKNAIKEEVLATGIQVPGAYVHQKENLQILLSKI